MDILYRHHGVDQHINITQVPKLWHKDNTLLLSLQHNMVMHESDLKLVLKDFNLDQVVTAANFTTTKKQEFETLMLQYKTTMTQRIKDAIASPGYTLDILAIDPTLIDQPPVPIPSVMVPFDEAVPIRTVIKTVKSPRKINVSLKIDKLEEGKILNVSKITQTGAGITTLKFNKNKKIFQTNDEYIESDNYDAFQRMIDLLPKKYKEGYKEDMARAKKYFDL